jgi:hypothetical protein
MEEAKKSEVYTLTSPWVNISIPHHHPRTLHLPLAYHVHVNSAAKSPADSHSDPRIEVIQKTKSVVAPVPQ